MRALHDSGLLLRDADSRFDALTELVRETLGTPAAFVSFVDLDRQVFAGHRGLPPSWAARGETPLSMSFCRHVVQRGAPMVVPDATVDPLHRGNAGIAELAITAYLGVPLRLPSGEVVGALAATDSRPRDWSEADLRKLQSAAAIVEGEIAVRLSETKWRMLFADMQEGFLVAEAVHAADGAVVDMRVIDANPAFVRLAALGSTDIVGKTLRGLAEADTAEPLVNGLGGAIGDAAPRVLEFALAGDGTQWREARMRPLGGDRACVLVADISLRKRDEQAFGEAVERRRIAADSGEIGFWEFDLESGTPVFDRRMRALYGVHDERELAPELAMDALYPADRPAVEAAFARLMSGEDETLSLQYRTIGVADGIVRSIHVSGRTLVGADGRARRLVGIGRDVSQSVATDDRRRVLSLELAHRLKNTLAMVQSLATQTLRSAPDLPTARASLSQRIQALSKAHDILLAENRDAGPIAAIIRSVVSVHDAEARIALDGPRLEVGPKAAMTLALLMHELAVNAVKYGSLSGTGGSVAISWRVEGALRSDPRLLVVDWHESGGPPVVAPTRTGFGTRLVSMGLAAAGGGSVDLDYAADGFRCRITAPVDQLSGSDG